MLVFYLASVLFFIHIKHTTLNVTAWTNTSYDEPLLIVIRQEKGLISLQLPDKEMFVDLLFLCL